MNDLPFKLYDIFFISCTFLCLIYVIAKAHVLFLWFPVFMLWKLCGGGGEYGSLVDSSVCHTQVYLRILAVCSETISWIRILNTHSSLQGEENAVCVCLFFLHDQVYFCVKTVFSKTVCWIKVFRHVVEVHMMPFVYSWTSHMLHKEITRSRTLVFHQMWKFPSDAINFPSRNISINFPSTFHQEIFPSIFHQLSISFPSTFHQE